MGTKKILVIAVLIVVIVAAAVYVAKRHSGSSVALPEAVLSIKVEKIDLKTLEIFTENAEDWDTRYAPDEHGRFKNPRTGTYSMVGIMKCAACGKEIPVPQLPEELEKRFERRPFTNSEHSKTKAEIVAFIRAYVCPLCGKLAFTGEEAPE